MGNQWFKFYGGEYLNDPKMKSLTDSERSCWVTLMCYASTSSIEGEVLYLNERQLMMDAGVDPQGEQWNKTVGVLKKFEQLGMAEVGSIGQIVITHWNDRQEGKNLTGYERIKRHRERSKAKGEIQKLQTTAFDEFWGAYPRKVGKQKAFEKWCIINPDDELKAKILAAVKEHSKSAQWQKDDGIFIPHPATWLYQRRWEDELKITKQQTGNGKFNKVKTTRT